MHRLLQIKSMCVYTLIECMYRSYFLCFTSPHVLIAMQVNFLMLNSLHAYIVAVHVIHDLEKVTKVMMEKCINIFVLPLIWGVHAFAVIYFD